MRTWSLVDGICRAKSRKMLHWHRLDHQASGIIQKKKRKKDLSRVHFFKADAMEFLEGMSSKVKLARTILLFPDPWPKHKHHKRRLIQPSFLELLAKKTRPSGHLFFRTDHSPYFEWTKELLEQSSYWQLVDQPLPFDHSSYFQDLLPDFNTCSACVSH